MDFVHVCDVLKSGVLFSNVQPDGKSLYLATAWLKRPSFPDLNFELQVPPSLLVYTAIKMKLCVHVLLLALGVISGHKCDETNDSNECDISDISSHLHLATKVTKASAGSTYLISEFQPNPPFSDPPEQLIELSGPAGAWFSGCIWSVEADNVGAKGKVDRATSVGGTFDANGLLVFPIPDLENPSFTIVLSSSPCPSLTDNVITGGFAFGGVIYDSIGVPDEEADEANLAEIREKLGYPPGTDFKFTGNEPKLVFRDDSVGDLYAVSNGGVIKNALGVQIDFGDFSGGDPLEPTFHSVNPTRGSGVIGDPHIHTLDGSHYTLLREGSFLLWRFGLPQPHVEWQIFAHYAGRQSFTKGLLLVDTSGSEPSSMEITSERCEWQTQSSSKKWSSVNSTVPEVLLSGPSSHMKLVGNQRKDMKKIQLFIADETVPVATLKVICRQGRHINMKLYMGNQKWKPFVSGELKGHKGQKDMPTSKSSMLELAGREDQEFEVTKTWAELGGSSHAQQYLQNFDVHQNLAFIQTCDPQAQADARALCQKHLGTVAHSSYFEECVYDVCSGAGEVAAEMAAEMLKF